MTKQQFEALMALRRSLGDVDTHCALDAEHYDELALDVGRPAPLVLLSCNGPVTVLRAE